MENCLVVVVKYGYLLEDKVGIESEGDSMCVLINGVEFSDYLSGRKRILIFFFFSI